MKIAFLYGIWEKLLYFYIALYKTVAISRNTVVRHCSISQSSCVSFSIKKNSRTVLFLYRRLKDLSCVYSITRNQSIEPIRFLCFTREFQKPGGTDSDFLFLFFHVCVQPSIYTFIPNRFVKKKKQLNISIFNFHWIPNYQKKKAVNYKRQ